MADRALRLGDVVDDYCPRCRLLLNHDVASLTGHLIAKVTCRTCHNTHDYRHAEVPTRRSKKGAVDKQKLMAEVLAGMGRPPGAPAPALAHPSATAAGPVVPPPAAAPADLPPPPTRKRRDLWAELDRIRQKK